MKIGFFFLAFFCLLLWTASPLMAQMMEETIDEEAVTTSAVTESASAKPAKPGEGGQGRTDSFDPGPNNCFVYGVILLGLLGSLISMLLIRTALANSRWSLADALSEKVELTERGEDGKPLFDDNNQPLLIKTMQPSSSRMVALMGTIAILFLFLSFGAFALFHFGTTGKMPDSIDKVVTFLTAGLTLFAPYVVNKFSKSFEMLSPKR